MDQVELHVAAPWEMACSSRLALMSATAQGTSMYRELRELERQATETLERGCYASASSPVPAAKPIHNFAPGSDCGRATMKRTTGT